MFWGEQRREQHIKDLGQEAYELFSAGKYREALTRYQEWIRLAPLDPQPWDDSTSCLFKLGDFPGAINHADEAIRLSQSRVPGPWQKKGECFRGLMRWGDALACFDRAIAIDPHFVISHAYRMHVLADLERPEDVLLAYLQYKNYGGEDTNWDVLNEVFRAQMKLERWLDAIDTAKRWEALGGEDKFREASLQDTLPLAYERVGRAAFEKNDSAAAISAFERLIQIAPAWPDAVRMLAASLVLGGREVEAVHFLQDAIDRDPNNAALEAALGILLWRLNRIDEAAQHLDAALALAPRHAPALTARAQILNRQRDYDAGLAFANRAVDAAPESMDAQLARGVALQGLGRLEEAFGVYDGLTHDGRESAELMLRKGSLQMFWGRPAQAMELLDKALELEESLVDALVMKAHCLDLLGRGSETDDVLDRAASLRPDDPRPWIGKANRKFMDEDVYNADRFVKQALNLDPQSLLALCIKAAVLYGLGIHAYALQQCDRALTIDAGMRTAWDLKGMALLASGKPGDALVCFDQAVQMQPWQWDGREPATFGMLGVIKGAYNPTAGHQLFDSGSNHATLTQKSRALAKLGRKDEALTLIEQAIALCVADSLDYSDAWVVKGQLLLDAGRKAEALDMFTIALRLEPSSREATDGKAQCGS